MRIALIGYDGFVGRALYKKILNNKFDVIGVNRSNYDGFKEYVFDIIINAAMPSKRFWALNNPFDDFDATVRLTADLIYNWKYKKFVQISTVSARCQLDHPYGINKACAENLVLNKSKKNLIIRLGALFGKGLDKGVIFGMKKGNKIFVSRDSRYNYISTDKAAEIIIQKLDESGILEIGAKDQISLKEIANYFKWNIDFGNKFESQHTENPDENYPKARKVLKFMKDQNE